MRFGRKFGPLAVLVAGASLLVACGGRDLPTDPNEIKNRLEQPNGGFDESDEAPGFGDSELGALPVDPIPGAKALPPTEPMPGCAPALGGFLMGKWKNLAGGVGHFKGRWTSLEGKVTGHLAGLFAIGPKGYGQFYGKYIHRNGRFGGLIHGKLAHGFFDGEWRGKKGQKGRLWGYYDGAGVVPQPVPVPERMPLPAPTLDDDGVGGESGKLILPPPPFPVKGGMFFGFWEQQPNCPPMSLCAIQGGYCTEVPACPPGAMCKRAPTCKDGYYDAGPKPCMTFASPGEPPAAEPLQPYADAPAPPRRLPDPGPMPPAETTCRLPGPILPPPPPPPPGAGQEGDNCGDNGVKCADGLYCATGWCGTPPVIGICKKNGTCEWAGDCSNPDNAWPHVKCMGHAECTDNTCDWICDATSN